MVEKLRRGATRNLALLARLFGVLCVAFAQNGSLAYWNLPPDRVDSLLLHVPDDDHDRYLRLRDEFAGLHCSPDLMQNSQLAARTPPTSSAPCREKAKISHCRCAR
jgi:hypothetical protein